MRILRTPGWNYQPFGDALSHKQVRSASVWRFGRRDLSDRLFEVHEYRDDSGLFLAMKRPGEYPSASQLN